MESDDKLLERLLSLVHESPEEDEPRLVYADALMQRGEPLGEFIALQISVYRRAGDGKQRRAWRARAEELLAANVRRWLGPIHPVLLPDFTFERGFLARCAVAAARADRLAPIEGHPLWATVHSLSGSLRIALHPSLTSLRHLSADMERALKLEELRLPWDALLSGRERPFRSLVYQPSRAAGARELDLLGECASMPHLQQLAVRDPRDRVVRALLYAPVLARISSLSLTLGSELPAAFDELLLAAPTPELRLEASRVGLSVTLTRDERAYSALEVHSCGLGSAAQLDLIASRLPSLQIASVPAPEGRWWIDELIESLWARNITVATK